VKVTANILHYIANLYYCFTRNAFRLTSSQIQRIVFALKYQEWLGKVISVELYFKSQLLKTVELI